MVSHRKPAKPAFDPRTVKENIVETPLNEEMSKSFLEYAYSVIYARAPGSYTHLGASTGSLVASR